MSGGVVAFFDKTCRCGRRYGWRGTFHDDPGACERCLRRKPGAKAPPRCQHLHTAMCTDGVRRCRECGFAMPDLSLPPNNR